MPIAKALNLNGKKLSMLKIPRFISIPAWVFFPLLFLAPYWPLVRGTAGEAYNIRGDNERSNLELTHTILGLMGRDQSMIRYVADRPGHDRRYAVDGAKMAQELGWHPTRSAWPDALAATVEWYRQNQDWWRRVKSGQYREYYRQQYGS